MKKSAVILLNLGGPISTNNIKSFLFNLFMDENIVALPQPFRFALATLICTVRTPKIKKSYETMGGKTPLLENTRLQKVALQEAFDELNDGKKYKVFTVMRYSFPRVKHVEKYIKKFAPDEVILLPLYPQYSTTTSKSSIEDFEKNLKPKKLNLKEYKKIETFFKNDGFLTAHCELLLKAYEEMLAKQKEQENDRVINIVFSAHGIPKDYIKKRNDPYEKHIEQSCDLIRNKFVKMLDGKKINIKFTLAYQSRIGLQKWLGPNISEVIEQAGKDKEDLIIIPISFVSDHIETLIELDEEYREYSEEKGVKNFIRVDSVQCHEAFIKGLVEEVKDC